MTINTTVKVVSIIILFVWYIDSTIKYKYPSLIENQFRNSPYSYFNKHNTFVLKNNKKRSRGRTWLKFYFNDWCHEFSKVFELGIFSDIIVMPNLSAYV